MNDAIQDGDIVLFQNADHQSYKLLDVIPCKYPDRGETVFIKRLVGLPGDRIAIMDGYLYVNGTKYDESYINDAYRVAGGSNGYTFSEVYVPKKGDILCLRYMDEAKTRVAMTVNGEVWPWRGICSDGISDSGDRLCYSSSGSLILNGMDISKDVEAIIGLVETEFKLEKDLYFVMGDHRNNSNDSRAQGPLSEDYLLGRMIALLNYNEDIGDFEVVVK